MRFFSFELGRKLLRNFVLLLCPPNTLPIEGAASDGLDLGEVVDLHWRVPVSGGGVGELAVVVAPRGPHRAIRHQPQAASRIVTRKPRFARRTAVSALGCTATDEDPHFIYKQLCMYGLTLHRPEQVIDLLW
jgi:hypothetical protein